MERKFLFLYPIERIFELEVKNGWRWKDNGRPFREEYSEALNQCIDLRYRQHDFKIYWAVFSDTAVSNVVHLAKGDRVINVGMSSKRHYDKKEYPRPGFILDKVLPASRLVVAGFHLNDCVERVARAAYRRGEHVLVDDDLTEHFVMKWFRYGIAADKFPTFRAEKAAVREMFKLIKRGPWRVDYYKLWNHQRLSG